MSQDSLLSEFLEVFPDDSAALPLLCNEVGVPLGHSHPALLAELAGFTDKRRIDEIKRPYVWLSSYYFLLDSVIDKHTRHHLDALYLTHLLALAIQRLLDITDRVTPTARHKIHRLLYQHVARNAQAVRIENQLCSSPLENDISLERESTVGRSTSFLLFYEIFCILADAPINNELYNLLEELVYYIQIGDDLCDWEADFAEGRWTVFIRRCFRQAGTILNFHQMEHFVYCSGFYEATLAEVIAALNSISLQVKPLSRLPSPLLIGYIDKHSTNLRAALLKAIILKLSVRDETTAY